MITPAIDEAIRVYEKHCLNFIPANHVTDYAKGTADIRTEISEAEHYQHLVAMALSGSVEASESILRLYGSMVLSGENPPQAFADYVALNLLEYFSVTDEGKHKHKADLLYKSFGLSEKKSKSWDATKQDIKITQAITASIKNGSKVTDAIQTIAGEFCISKEKAREIYYRLNKQI